jgi:hypothetical protein
LNLTVRMCLTASRVIQSEPNRNQHPALERGPAAPSRHESPSRTHSRDRGIIENCEARCFSKLDADDAAVRTDQHSQGDCALLRSPSRYRWIRRGRIHAVVGMRGEIRSADTAGASFVGIAGTVTVSRDRSRCAGRRRSSVEAGYGGPSIRFCCARGGRRSGLNASARPLHFLVMILGMLRVRAIPMPRSRRRFELGGFRRRASRTSRASAPSWALADIRQVGNYPFAASNGYARRGIDESADDADMCAHGYRQRRDTSSLVFVAMRTVLFVFQSPRPIPRMEQPGARVTGKRS